LKLFAAKGFDATSIEEIAEAAQVAPRTFYRYFPTKEDVVFSDTIAEARFCEGLAVRREGETEVERVARALCDAMVADADRLDSVRRLVSVTPALQGRSLLMMWRSFDLLAQALAGPRASSHARSRAHLVAGAVGVAVRLAVFAWIDEGKRGSAWKHCRAAMRLISDAFAFQDP